MDEMTDLEMEQQRHGYFGSDPCILLSTANFPQPNIHTVLTASGNTTNIDSHYVPDAYDNALIYGVTQYNGIQQQHNRGMSVAAPANLYYSGNNPSSGTGVLPLPLNHRVSDRLPTPSTYTASRDDFVGGGGFIDDVRGPHKRKIADGIGGNFQYYNASASSSVAPANARHPDGANAMEAASYCLPQYRGNGIPSVMEVGPHVSVWNRSGEYEHNHLIQGNYLRQHFQPATPPWFDRQLSSNNCDGPTAAWNQSLRMPYMQAPNVSRSSLDNANMGLPRYHEAASNRSGLRLPYPPVNHQHHIYHHPASPVQGVRGHSINFHPRVSAASRVPTNPSRNTVIPAQNGFEMGARHVGPAPSAGLRIYHPRRGATPETSLEHRSFLHMSAFQVDDVAIFDMPEFYEVGDYVDHHSDMRLDIEDMSYEELLALGERIGNVSTGLSDETITDQLKTKAYSTPESDINLEEEASEDRETDSCIICQEEYKDQEKIGMLQCGHEYHADCLKKWLLVKNVCPICKSEALAPARKDA